MSNSYFIFGDIDSRDYGLIVSTTDDFSTSVRDYTVISVAGRSGDIYKDNRKYQNVPVTYHCSVDSKRWLGFGDAFEAFRRAMNQTVGYQKLEDSYRPGIYREAVLAAQIKPSSNGPAWNIGEFDIVLSCKPQIWLKDRSISLKLSPVVKGYINYDGYHVANDAYRTLNYLEVEQGANINLRLKKPATCTVYVREYGGGSITTRTQGTLTESNQVISFTAGENVDTIALYWAAAELEDNALSIVAGGRYVETVCNDGPVIINDTGYTIYPEIGIAREYSFTKKISFLFGELTIEISGMASRKKIVIDSESQAITDGNGANASDSICIKEGDDFAYDFPEIPPGNTIIRTAGYVDDGNSNPKGPVTITVCGTARTV